MTIPIGDRLGHHLKRTEQELIAAKHAALQPFGLTVPQYTVLLVLSNESGLSGAALARRCLVTPQTMSTVLTTLETKELISRQNHPIHTHIHEIELTRKGRALLKRADTVAVDVEQRLHDEFTPEERSALIDSLARCGKVLGEALAENTAKRRKK
jgi:DNA-binding MarR family transcriptional regulator